MHRGTDAQQSGRDQAFPELANLLAIFLETVDRQIALPCQLAQQFTVPRAKTIA